MKRIADAQTTADATTFGLAERVKGFLNARRGGCSRVSVGAERGTIRLSGPVGSFFLRQMAVELAKQVDGVGDVVDDLQVD